jgi:hypothetical protein
MLSPAKSILLAFNALFLAHPIWTIDPAYKAILFALDCCNHGVRLIAVLD